MKQREDIKTRYRNYAKVFLDFANAHTTDDAGSKFIPNLQVAFNLPDAVPSSITGEDIPDELNKFETISEFLLNLSGKEQEIMTFIIEEQTLFDEIRELVSGPYYFENEYDLESRKLLVKKLEKEPMGDLDGCFDYAEREYDIKIDDKNELYTLVDGPSKKMRHERKGRLFNACTRLMEVGSGLCKLCNSRDDEVFQRMEGMADRCKRVLQEHNYIKNVQAKMSMFLDYMITRSTKRIFRDGDSVSYFLNAYNSISRPETYYLSEENIFPTLPIFPAPFYLNRFDTIPGEIPPGCNILDEYYLFPLAYCLIEYFKDGTNGQYIKKCEECRKYFRRNTSRTEKDDRYFCSNRCRMNFHNTQKSKK